MNSLLTDSHGFGKLYECELTQLNMWRLSQVVRHGSATPLSPVQIRQTPFQREPERFSFFFSWKAIHSKNFWYE